MRELSTTQRSYGRDAFPLPTDILDQLEKSKYCSTIYLAQGYHQVPMNTAVCEKTDFSTDKGHYKFLRMPFGLKGAPGTFQRLMNKVLLGLNGLMVFVYLDDIIIYTQDLPEYSQNLTEILSKILSFISTPGKNNCFAFFRGNFQ